MAGTISSSSNPLFDDFTLLAWKLEKLGFIYQQGQVILLEADYK